MASSSGALQEQPPVPIDDPREDEPLLGPRDEEAEIDEADDFPKDEESVLYNLFTGTATITQFGIWMLTILVWSSILNHPLILFSAHPLLNTTALLLQIQATLVLQPTATPVQKHAGTRVHYILQGVSALTFLAAFLVIEINKGDHARLTSVHGILGLTTYIVLVLQALGGVVQYFLPRVVLGGAERGRRLYKYHRGLGYVLLMLELATVAAATQTTFNQSVLAIPLWAVVPAAVVILVGVGVRVKKGKLGL